VVALVEGHAGLVTGADGGIEGATALALAREEAARRQGPLESGKQHPYRFQRR
jgi:NAD(P)-dependent dehydrogenase (short-subunit alcohol dehydrogenase family)